MGMAVGAGSGIPRPHATGANSPGRISGRSSTSRPAGSTSTATRWGRCRGGRKRRRSGSSRIGRPCAIGGLARREAGVVPTLAEGARARRDGRPGRRGRGRGGRRELDDGQPPPAPRDLYRPARGRAKILADAPSFPTDLYAIESHPWLREPTWRPNSSWSIALTAGPVRGGDRRGIHGRGSRSPGADGRLPERNCSSAARIAAEGDRGSSSRSTPRTPVGVVPHALSGLGVDAPSGARTNTQRRPRCRRGPVSEPPALRRRSGPGWVVREPQGPAIRDGASLRARGRGRTLADRHAADLGMALIAALETIREAGSMRSAPSRSP